MLYHYTDYIALNGIVKNRELRLNNVLNMNDDAEMRFCMRGIYDSVIQKLIDNNYSDKIRDVSVLFQNEFGEEFNFSSYATCFSCFYDDAAQWERYGKGGQGVCISFDEKMLQRIIVKAGGTILLKNVYYNQNFDSFEITEQFYRLFSETVKISDCIDDFEGLMKEAWITSATVKHPSFRNENEVRMMVTPTLTDSFSVAPEYSITSGKIKKYYPLNLDILCLKAGICMEDLIKEVRIGPTSTQSVAILRDYLRDAGYTQLSEHVMVSECPLRMPE